MRWPEPSGQLEAGRVWVRGLAGSGFLGGAGVGPPRRRSAMAEPVRHAPSDRAAGSIESRQRSARRPRPLLPRHPTAILATTIRRRRAERPEPGSGPVEFDFAKPDRTAALSAPLRAGARRTIPDPPERLHTAPFARRR